MGGCRCTYRNCTSKSDGKIHMFHYPVFDKLRCHQWLVNAHKLEFLNLKVSQLKNRVVCQHHFTEENFMNYKKDKLRFDAIPTENGPYCDWNDIAQELNNKIHPVIILEDIENDCAPFNKKANASMRYRDFLLNSEFDDQGAYDDKISLPNSNGDFNLKTDYILGNNKATIKNEPILLQNINLGISQQNKQRSDNNKSLGQPTKIVSSYANINNEDKVNKKDVLPQMNCDATFIGRLPESNNRNINEVRKVPPKVRIISEKKIKEPIKIRGSFKKVSPSITITPFKLNNSNTNLIPIGIVNAKSEPPIVQQAQPIEKSYTVQVEYEPLQSNTINTTSTESIITAPVSTPVLPQVVTINKIDAKSKEIGDKLMKSKQKDKEQTEKKISLLKNKVSPERMAAINTKREFNMKLRNIIEACLDTKDNNKQNNKTKKENTVKEINNTITTTPSNPECKTQESFKSYQTSHSDLPNIQQYTIAFLEARIRKMENNLLNKIDENRQQISDMKDKIGTSYSRKRDCHVQTNESEESYKKFLFQEISKFLCPSSNSTIYEELFINKYAVTEQINKPRSKRKRKS